MILSVQTLFLPRESIFYMEEWLVYHTLLGFDKFRLYDNTGSKGDMSSAFLKFDSRTKYGLPMVSREFSDEKIRSVVDEICNKFNVEIVDWPSQYYTNETQMSAVIDHLKSDNSDYTAFIDMDEYICVGFGLGIHDFIKNELINKGYCGVRMRQQKMPHILKAKMFGDKRVWTLNDTFEMNTKNWAPKSIVPTRSVALGTNIHEIKCMGEILDQPDKSLIRINHYNTNEYQMHWLRSNHKNFDNETPLDKLKLGQSFDFHMDAFKEKMSNWTYVNLEER